MSALILGLTKVRNSASMKQMNQNTAEPVFLRRFMSSDEGWGNDQGREVYLKLLDHVEAHPGQYIFGLSLDGVKKTDASFPRESVVELARRFRGEKGFYVFHIESKDLKDNWDAAADKREQPLFLWDHDHYEILGPKPGGSSDLVAYVVMRGPVTAGEVAKRYRLPVNNVSNRLKLLVDDGFLLRKQQDASTGGIEFVYYPIR